MRFFTDNPSLEKIMQDKRRSSNDVHAALPKNHACYGCANYGRFCFALCHRNLTENKNMKEKKHEVNNR